MYREQVAFMKQPDGERDNQNPKASIGIMCPHVFSFFLFETVYKNLENVEFVLDFTVLPGGIPCPDWYKKRIRNYLKREAVYFRDFEESGLTPGEFFSKYHTLVGASFDGLITHVCNQTKKKVRVMHSLVKDLWNFNVTNAHFDLVTCPSKQSAKKIERLYGVATAVTGDPKHDRYVLGVSAPANIEEIVAIDRTRKSILFAPTWGNLSSEEKILPILMELSQRYTVFYKPHHMTMLSRYEFIQSLTETSNIHVIDETMRLSDIFGSIDVVITDNSNVIFEALAAEKRIVLIDTALNGKVSATNVPCFTFREGKFGGVPTSLESLEQRVKKEGQEIAPVVRMVSKYIEDKFPPLAMSLASAIESSGDSVFLGRQKHILNEYLVEKDGKAGERIAREIKRITDQYAVETKSELGPYVGDYQDRIRQETHDAFGRSKRDVLDEERISHIRRLPPMEKVKKIIELFY